MSRKNINECIASRAFASLILDSEYEAAPAFDLPAVVYCRILIEDLYQCTISAPDRAAAIEIFNNWHKN